MGVITSLPAPRPLTPQAADQVQALHALLRHSRRVCVFTGAGVSCPSGIPDFRSAAGIYNQRDGYTYSPEEMVSHDFFLRRCADFYDFYRDKMVWPTAAPNAFHRWAAGLEKDGRQVTVVTQNIDGLHQAAGSTRVLELHGSIHRNRCMDCDAFYPLSAVTGCAGVPRCQRCGGVIKPEVVLYGEQLDDATVMAAVRAIAAADLLLVAGTSLAVYPAASFLGYFQGEHLVVLNLSPTPADTRAELAIAADVAAVAERLQQLDGEN